MKALSLWQPYGSLIAHGLKVYETRGRPTHYRGPLLVHAAKRWTNAEAARLASLRCAHLGIDVAFRGLDDFPPLGAVVAVARVVDCVPMTRSVIYAQTDLELDVGAWEPGRFAWKLDRVRRVDPPVPCLGAQGLWDLSRWQFDEEIPPRNAAATGYDRLRELYDEVARGG